MFAIEAMRVRENSSLSRSLWEGLYREVALNIKINKYHLVFTEQRLVNSVHGYRE